MVHNKGKGGENMTELEKKKLLEQQGVPQTPTAVAPAAVGNYNPGQNVQDA